MELHESARKHGVSDEDIFHALDRALVEFDLGDDDSPMRRLVIGPDLAGNLLEIVVLDFDDGREMAIHAMALRVKFLKVIEGLLEGGSDG